MNAFKGAAFGSLLVPIVAAFAALSLSACGGNGGGGSNASLFKTVTLNGAQENPAVTTAATGTGFIAVDEGSGAVHGSITTFGIAGNAAHIHEGAPGVNGGILIPLAEGPPGTWSVTDGATLTPSQVESFKAGNLYVNVHTTANPNGETRGQIGRQVWFATLTGAQETPPNTSAASGTARFVFDPDTHVMFGTVATSGVTGTASHIHTGAIGVQAGVTIPFTGGPTTWTMPSTVLTDAQVASLVSGNFYANVHSSAFPAGEIRGQLYQPAKLANLSGAQETPPNSSTATGVGWLVVNPFTKGVAGRIETTGIVSTNAHVHRGPIGVLSPVVIPMTHSSAPVWVVPDGVTISDDLLLAFMTGGLYLNVHSAALPQGEIRGQLITGQ
ncbi:MAG: CHRD domain-containing protein [Usitatibacter sp.]